MKLETPNRAQRTPEEAKGDLRGSQRRFWEGQVDPRAPRCAPREARMPPESAKGTPKEALGEQHGLQDGPREPKEGVNR